MDYKAVIALKTNNVWDTEARVNEIWEIKEWLDELVKWQRGMYSVQYLTTSQQLLVWFREERHATMCSLRWS
jgi:hypothetical protein